MTFQILLAEDSKEHSTLLKKILTRAGYDVEHVVNGQLAFESIKKSKPDLLITDVIMPIMTGFELLTRLKEEGIELKTIVLTAAKDEESVLQGLDAGATDYISKPYSPSEVIARVKRHLANTP